MGEERTAGQKSIFRPTHSVVGGKQHTVCDSGGGTRKIVLTVAQISTVGVELFVVCLDASTGFVECAELH